MKKAYILFLLFVFIVSFNNAQGQTSIPNAPPENKNTFDHVISLNTVRLVNGYVDLQYEHFLTNRTSIRGGFGIGNYRKKIGKRASKDFGKEFGETTIYDNKEHILKSFAVNVDYRFYILNSVPAPKGLYFGGGVEYRKIEDIFNYTIKTRDKPESSITNYSLVSLKALFGYQFIIAKNFIINPYTGGGYFIGKSRSKDLPIRVDLDVGLTIGYGF